MARRTPARSVNQRILDRLERIEALLSTEQKEEDVILQDENKQQAEMEKLERIEEEIKRDVMPHPLARITYHDITKGLIGAFFGVVGHFAFFYGHHIAETLSDARAVSLFVVSLLLLVLFLYFSGFRRIKEYNRYLPLRVLVIYSTAIIVATAVLFLFNIIPFPPEPHELFLEVSAVSILAVMGAATADLIGGE